MMNEVGSPKTLTVTGVVTPKAGKIIGFFVHSGTPTLVLHDNASAASGTVIFSSTVLRAVEYFPFPCAYANGIFATMTNAGNITFLLG